MTIPPPDLSARPLSTRVECSLAVTPDVVFRAWTQHLDQWLAAPGTVLMTPEANTAFCFETHHGEFRAPYYGRIVRLEPDALLEMTWLSIGTQGTETLLTLELTLAETGTLVRLTHAGFPEEELRAAHERVWPELLAHLDAQFSG